MVPVLHDNGAGFLLGAVGDFNVCRLKYPFYQSNLSIAQSIDQINQPILSIYQISRSINQSIYRSNQSIDSSLSNPSNQSLNRIKSLNQVDRIV